MSPFVDDVEYLVAYPNLGVSRQLASVFTGTTTVDDLSRFYHFVQSSPPLVWIYSFAFLVNTVHLRARNIGIVFYDLVTHYETIQIHVQVLLVLVLAYAKP